MAFIQQPDRTTMPEPGKHIQLQLTEPELVVLDNGIKTYVINEGQEDFSRLDIIFDAGSSFQSKNLVAGSTIHLLIDGTKEMSSAEIAQKLDYHGAIIDTNLSKDKAGLTLYSLNKHLPELLPLISDMVLNSSFYDDELTNYIQRKKQQFLLNSDKVRYKAMLEFNKLVFGSNSAYGRVVELTDYDNLNRSDIVEFFKTRFTPANTYILISGKKNNSVISLINKHFGFNWSNQPIAPSSTINIVNDIEEMEKFVEKDGTLQSAIRIGRPIISKHHSDYNSLIVLNTILGGYFGSRLMTNLRENKGFTYGVNSYMMNYKHGGFFSIATEVNAQNTNAALEVIKNEFNRLCNEAISAEELSLVKNYIYGTYLRSFDGPMALAERYRSAKDLDLSFDYYIKSLNNMMLQTPKQLQEIANKYFSYDDMIKLVVGSMDNNKN